MHIAGTILIVLSIFLGSEAGPCVFFIGVAMTGSWLGKKFASWDCKRSDRR